jgi:hydrogenase expression/formation protein HypC
MCLGVPARILELSAGHDDLARVDVSGVRRTINVALLGDESLTVGDWVLIHVGFAMAKIDEAEAARALESLKLLGQGFVDDLEAFGNSRIE